MLSVSCSRKKAGNNAAGWRCRFFLAINNGDHVCRGASFCERAPASAHWNARYTLITRLYVCRSHSRVARTRQDPIDGPWGGWRKKGLEPRMNGGFIHVAAFPRAHTPLAFWFCFYRGGTDHRCYMRPPRVSLRGNNALVSDAVASALGAKPGPIYEPDTDALTLWFGAEIDALSIVGRASALDLNSFWGLFVSGSIIRRLRCDVLRTINWLLFVDDNLTRGKTANPN